MSIAETALPDLICRSPVELADAWIAISRVGVSAFKKVIVCPMYELDVSLCNVGVCSCRIYALKSALVVLKFDVRKAGTDGST